MAFNCSTSINTPQINEILCDSEYLKFVVKNFMPLNFTIFITFAYLFVSILCARAPKVMLLTLSRKIPGRSPPNLPKFTEFLFSARVANFNLIFFFLISWFEGQVTLNSADSFEGNILDGGYCIQYSKWIQLQIGSLSRTTLKRENVLEVKSISCGKSFVCSSLLLKSFIRMLF